MSLVNIDPKTFPSLKGKVVVVLGTISDIVSLSVYYYPLSTNTKLTHHIPGATTGIGASVVSQLTGKHSPAKTTLARWYLPQE